MSHDFNKIDFTYENLSQEALDFIQEITVGKIHESNSRDTSSTTSGSSTSSSKLNRNTSSTTTSTSKRRRNHRHATSTNNSEMDSDGTKKLRHRSCKVSGTPSFRTTSASESDYSRGSRSVTSDGGGNDSSCSSDPASSIVSDEGTDSFTGGDKKLSETFQKIVSKGGEFMKWDYSAEEFAEFVQPVRPLAGMVLYAFNERGFLKSAPGGAATSSSSGVCCGTASVKISMRPQRVNYWAECVDKLYNNRLPFHNSLHGLDTLQAVHGIIETPTIHDILSDEHVLALCILTLFFIY